MSEEVSEEPSEGASEGASEEVSEGATEGPSEEASEEASKGQVEAALREGWSGTDDEARQAHLVLDESDRMMHKAILHARRFAVDGVLETSMDSQNVEKGINPVPGFVMEQAIGLKRRLGLVFSEPPELQEMAAEMAATTENTPST